LRGRNRDRTRMDVIKPEEARLLREFQEREPADDGLE
jgi:hypothetical protein